MDRHTFSITMDRELIRKLEEEAKKNHRKRSPEINVAVEFYLKYKDSVLLHHTPDSPTETQKSVVNNNTPDINTDLVLSDMPEF